jgi:hypothetical protein
MLGVPCSTDDAKWAEGSKCTRRFTDDFVQSDCYRQWLTSVPFGEDFNYVGSTTEGKMRVRSYVGQGQGGQDTGGYDVAIGRAIEGGMTSAPNAVVVDWLSDPHEAKEAVVLKAEAMAETYYLIILICTVIQVRSRPLLVVVCCALRVHLALMLLLTFFQAVLMMFSGNRHSDGTIMEDGTRRRIVLFLIVLLWGAAMISMFCYRYGYAVDSKSPPDTAEVCFSDHFICSGHAYFRRQARRADDGLWGDGLFYGLVSAFVQSGIYGHLRTQLPGKQAPVLVAFSADQSLYVRLTAEMMRLYDLRTAGKGQTAVLERSLRQNPACAGDASCTKRRRASTAAARKRAVRYGVR